MKSLGLFLCTLVVGTSSFADSHYFCSSKNFDLDLVILQSNQVRIESQKGKITLNLNPSYASRDSLFIDGENEFSAKLAEIVDVTGEAQIFVSDYQILTQTKKLTIKWIEGSKTTRVIVACDLYVPQK